MSVAGMAAQLSLTNGPDARGLIAWTARAMSSLPVPVSPQMSTVQPVGAAAATAVEDLAQRGALSDDLGEATGPGRRELAAAGQRLLHRLEEVLVGERLGEKLDGAGLHRPHRRRDVPVAGDEDDGDARVHPGELALEVEPGEARHLHVDDQAARRDAVVALQELPRREEGLGLEPRRAHEVADARAHRLIIIDHTHDRAAGAHDQPPWGCVLDDAVDGLEKLLFAERLVEEGDGAGTQRARPAPPRRSAR